jgi:hypothetical protein
MELNLKEVLKRNNITLINILSIKIQERERILIIFQWQAVKIHNLK